MLLSFAEFDSVPKGKLYQSLFNAIKDAVERGAIKPGEKLPSVRETAALLHISRTTVENAYTKLCIEGIAESFPQRGYYLIGLPQKSEPVQTPVSEDEKPVRFDFSGLRTDAAFSDTLLWKKTIRSVLNDSGELISYGDNQGEPGLRSALAEYAFQSRGVLAKPENIVVGAGIGPLLHILCGLLGRGICVGMENGGFAEAEHIFSEYGIPVLHTESDACGAKPEKLVQTKADTLFLLPSELSRFGITALSKRRNEFIKWVNSTDSRLIIEDDYNGELRYSARTVPCFQRIAPERTVYLGSFSKLLLPSVRIAYMGLPDHLLALFRKNARFYHQTCGKIEQLALEKYIRSGGLEKHLKRLRRLYFAKSQLLCRELANGLPGEESITLLESSLTVEVATGLALDGQTLFQTARQNGILLAPCEKPGTVRLCFAGIPAEDIPPAVETLKKSLKFCN